MTRTIGMLTVTSLFLWITVTGAATLPDSEAAVRLVPGPKQVLFKDSPEVVLSGTLIFSIEFAENDGNAQKLAARIFERQFENKPNIVFFQNNNLPKDTEAYRIRIAGKNGPLSTTGFGDVHVCWFPEMMLI